LFPIDAGTVHLDHKAAVLTALYIDRGSEKPDSDRNRATFCLLRSIHQSLTRALHISTTVLVRLPPVGVDDGFQGFLATGALECFLSTIQLVGQAGPALKSGSGSFHPERRYAR